MRDFFEISFSKGEEKKRSVKRKIFLEIGLTKGKRYGIISWYKNEVWLSLVERYVRDVEVASSNLVTSTKKGTGIAKGDSRSFFA